MKLCSREKYSDIKLVRKTLRSLPEKFAYKVVAIEEARDLNTMSLKELMGSLQTFELNLKMNKKEKSIALQAEKHESSDEGNVSDDESVDLLTQSFNRYLKRMKKRRILKVRERGINFKGTRRLQILLKTRNQENEFNAENVKVLTTYN